MVLCYCYGVVLLLWCCVTVMVLCYCYGIVLLLWCCVTVMVLCYCYCVVLLAPIPNFHKDWRKPYLLPVNGAVISHANNPPFTADKFHATVLKYRSAETFGTLQLHIETRM